LRIALIYYIIYIKKREKGTFMKRNDYVTYVHPDTKKVIICTVEEMYGDGHVLLYAVDSNEAFLANMYEIVEY